MGAIMVDETVTDTERTSIEEAVRALNDDRWAAAEQVDADRMFATFSDPYNAGFINVGVFYPSLDASVSYFRDLFSQLQGQKIDMDETRVSVLASNVALLTMHGSFTATLKEGGTFQSPFAVTFVCAKMGNDWRIVHAHQSFPMPES
jgi:uncharacterized protein (TIGR02246 family)